MMEPPLTMSWPQKRFELKFCNSVLETFVVLFRSFASMFFFSFSFFLYVTHFFFLFFFLYFFLSFLSFDRSVLSSFPSFYLLFLLYFFRYLSRYKRLLYFLRTLHYVFLNPSVMFRHFTEPCKNRPEVKCSNLYLFSLEILSFLSFSKQDDNLPMQSLSGFKNNGKGWFHVKLCLPI